MTLDVRRTLGPQLARLSRFAVSRLVSTRLAPSSPRRGNTKPRPNANPRARLAPEGPVFRVNAGMTRALLSRTTARNHAREVTMYNIISTTMFLLFYLLTLSLFLPFSDDLVTCNSRHQLGRRNLRAPFVPVSFSHDRLRPEPLSARVPPILRLCYRTILRCSWEETLSSPHENVAALLLHFSRGDRSIGVSLVEKE